MTIKEISIFVQNKKGKLSAISKLLGEENIHIRGFTMADTAEGYGIFRLVVDYNEKAKRILKENHYTVSDDDVLGVKIPDKAGALSQVLDLLSNNGINVEYLYIAANSFLIMKVDDALKAEKILLNQGHKVIENALEI